MSRRSPRRLRSEQRVEKAGQTAGPAAEQLAEPPPTVRTIWVVLAVLVMLSVHTTLAVRSLIQENPTIDEVVHLPAGLTYWQKGTFRLYHHNPPLVKLLAAAPLLWEKPRVDYTRRSWTSEPPNKAVLAHEFMELNARDYFELFTRSRLLMPIFSIIGGLVVFFWSRALYGCVGGLLSLALWILCPNVLAHTRLITTDMGATSLGALATFVYWRELKNPSWRLAVLAGICLGLAQLTKFSLVLLYGLWPLLLLLRLATEPSMVRKLRVMALHLAAIVAISVLVIDVGYGFEGVGIRLGDFEFICQTLTRPVPPGVVRPRSSDDLFDGAWRYRMNRFRNTALAGLPVPLPKHYVLGFDEQKIEAEGIPRKFRNPTADDTIDGYPVFLDGKIAQKSWWYYYLLTLVYKVPEGTWLLVVGSMLMLVCSKRARASLFDEATVLVVPVVVLFVMSTLTNINLGLRYVLPIFPYMFISTGKLAPWALGIADRSRRRLATGGIACGLLATALATLTIHPHYLAYFNLVSGGPAHGADHLIDSNIDWGQDLVNLRKWLATNAPGESIGLAYFGQIHPRIFDARGQGFPWFLPPPRPGTVKLDPNDPKADPIPRYTYRRDRFRLEPGLYAVSASLVKGLPWRVYDSESGAFGKTRWAPYGVWIGAFSYFDDLKPIARIGESISIYRVTPDDAARLAHYWDNPAPLP